MRKSSQTGRDILSPQRNAGNKVYALNESMSQEKRRNASANPDILLKSQRNLLTQAKKIAFLHNAYTKDLMSPMLMKKLPHTPKTTASLKDLGVRSSLD